MTRSALVSISLLALTWGCGGDSKTAGPEPQTAAKADKPAPDQKVEEAKKPEPKKPEPPAPAAELGKPAPDFELADISGTRHTLTQYRGKIVVLEWFNPECPFVKYSHGEGPLKTMASDVAGDDLVWLSVNSGAPGKQGHGAEKNKSAADGFGMKNPILLDEDGTVGRAYGALKTPHLFIVNAEGNLVYRGGIDNAPMGEVDGEGEKINYVANALADVRAGKDVGTAEARPYGCSVKYAS